MTRSLFHEDFGAGLADTRWQVFGEAVPHRGADGLAVLPAGTDPVFGGPAFTVTRGQDAPGGGRGDHVKWGALARSPADGTTSFEVPSAGALVCTLVMSGETAGVARHPFGAAVADPAADVRLAAVCMVVTDLASRTVFDFALTGSRVYALYERLPAPDGPGPAAFSYAVPVAERTPGRWHECRIRVDRGGARVTWVLDGRQVLSVDRIGHRVLGRDRLLLDHGGEEGEPVRLRRVGFGMGALTLLDGVGPDGRGLVRLDAADGFYHSVRHGPPVPQTFADDKSVPGSRLWGQGAVLRARRADVVRCPDSGG